MKILVIANLYHPYVIGGGEISTKILCEGLAEAGHSVNVLTSGKNSSEDIVDGISVFRKPNNIYWSYEKDEKPGLIKLFWHLLNEYNLIARKILRYELNRNSYDLLVTSTIDGFSGIVWKEASHRGIKVVHILRSYSLFCPRSGFFKNNSSCKNQCIECKLLTGFKKVHSNNYVDLVVGISEFILNKHIQLGYFKSADKVVIGNPLGLSRDTVNKGEKEEVELGFVGSIQEKKGLEILLEEFTKMTNPKLRLSIYGKCIDDDYCSFLKERYLDPRIRFYGFKSLKEIYQSLDILIVPSLWHEPFGRIIIEAYSYGIPVVGSNRGGIPELIIPNVTGLIFDPEIPGDLTMGIKNLLKNKSFLKMSSKCLEMSQNFSRNEIISQYSNRFKALIEGI